MVYARFASQLNRSGTRCTCLGFQTYATVLIHLPAIYLSKPMIFEEGILWFDLDNDWLLTVCGWQANETAAVSASFWTQVRILILHLSFMYYFSHYF